MEEKLIEMLAEQLDIDAAEITIESDLMQDLGADSLDIVQLLFALEKEFGVTFDDEELRDLKTVKDVVDAVNQKL